MQWEYYPTINDRYEGYIWTVAQSIYDKAQSAPSDSLNRAGVNALC